MSGADDMTTLTKVETDIIKDKVWADLLACYGEGEDTDWPYLTDLCDLIVKMFGEIIASFGDRRGR